MAQRIKVALVYGGPSKEHEVSLLSAKSIQKYIDRDKYDVLDVFISKSNQWHIDNQILNDSEAIEQLKKRVDFVFLAVHGTYGEDGELQRKLENANLKFNGSGSGSSAKSFDKELAQKEFEKNGLLVPKAQVISRGSFEVEINPPLVIKPVSQGSSVGISIIKDRGELKAAIVKARKFCPKVMAQEFIDGREVSCAVLETSENELQALPPTELIPINAEFYDYDAKYVPGATEEITPPNMPVTIITQIRTIAKKAHRVLKCAGYSRTDMIVQGDGKIFIIETNTLPGMTPTSILPQEATAAKINFTDLLDMIIGAAL